MQDWAKVHDTEWRLHLSYNPQASGLKERNNGILKQEIKLTGKTTLARRTKVVFQALIHLNDQAVVGPIAPYSRLETRVVTPNIVKLWKSLETAIAPTLTVDQCVVLLRTPSSIKPGKGVIYWNLQWDVPL